MARTIKSVFSRIFQILSEPESPVPTLGTSTARGSASTEADFLKWFFNPPSRERQEIYSDMEFMDGQIEEVGNGLSVLATYAACMQPDGAGFHLTWEPGTPELAIQLAEETIKRCEFRRKAYSFGRETLKFGDSFLQNVVTYDGFVSRVMFMPPATMTRNEDKYGLLPSGHTESNCAFYQKRITDDKPTAFFAPWQITHLRWEHSGSSPYGRPLLYGARDSYHKLQAMEAALSLNWLTCAFARLVYYIDVQGLSEDEAYARIQKFKKDLSSTEVKIGSSRENSLSLVKDIFLGVQHKDVQGQPIEDRTKVDLLDPSGNAFSNLDPIEYYRDKIIMATRVPKAYFGIEADVNAKATLIREDLRFSQTLQSLQALLTEAIRKAVHITWLLHEIDPSAIEGHIIWPEPIAVDKLEAAQAHSLQARGDEIFLNHGIIDGQYIAEQHLGMSTREYQIIQDRIKKAAKSPEDEDENTPSSGGEPPSSSPRDNVSKLSRDGTEPTHTPRDPTR